MCFAIWIISLVYCEQFLIEFETEMLGEWCIWTEDKIERVWRKVEKRLAQEFHGRSWGHGTATQGTSCMESFYINPSLSPCPFTRFLHWHHDPGIMEWVMSNPIFIAFPMNPSLLNVQEIHRLAEGSETFSPSTHILYKSIAARVMHRLAPCLLLRCFIKQHLRGWLSLSRHPVCQISYIWGCILISKLEF